jgi:hypothetical protein
MICLAMIVSAGGYILAKIDVKGAYLQTEMTGATIFMQSDKKFTQMILTFLPDLRKYVTPEGVLYTRLLKALYGCIQSSRLWFERLTHVLRREGYVHSPTDPCVMRKIVCQRIFIILMYVDNLLLLMDHREAKRMETVLTREFQWIVMSIGPVQSYLGMQITLEEKRVTVDIIYFIEQVLQPYTSLKSYLTPGTTMFFAVDDNSALLPTKDRKQFHTTTAKLLYLAK